MDGEGERPAGIETGEDAIAASVLCDGERVVISGGELTIGRALENGLVIATERASRRHARIYWGDRGWWIADLGSRHGTLVNGDPLGDRPRPLRGGDAIEIGDREIRFLSGAATRIASRETPVTEIKTIAFDGRTLRIGRDERNDVVLEDPNVSRFHAEVVESEGRVELRDLGSSNGTRLDGRLVEREVLQPGSAIGIGAYRLVFDGHSFVSRDERGSLRLAATEVTVRAGEKTILHEASVSIGPGELVAVIGESGAGKSTLLKLMAGVNDPSSGTVTVNGEPLAARLTDVGYVPQDDIVHALLSVREALGYAARLRLPSDASRQELGEAVDGAVAELALEEHGGTLIGSLSGGQRKRTGVACEVLGRPGLLFLDEPTTGMDPGLETRMMELFRALADRQRGLALVTHATKNLALCDRVLILARGGHLVFDGPPREALEFFEVDDYDGIYRALDEVPLQAWLGKARRPAAEREAPSVAPKRGAGKPPSSGLARQSAVLTSRALKLLVRDRRNLLLLLGQAPLLAIAGVGLFQSGVMEQPGGNPAQTIQMLFLALITVIWFGSIDAAREIVKERAVFEREAAIGTRLGAYLLSKLIVLFGLVTVQTLLYAGLLFAFRPLDEPPANWAAVFALLLAAGFAAVAMGLLISSVVSTEDQAMSVIPLAVIPQLLFAGTIVPLAQMPEPAHSISYAIFSQWGLASVGDVVDMNDRIAADPAFSRANPYGEAFFDVAFGAGLWIQAGFAALFLVGVVFLLRARTRR
ncbi:MAG: FHA domain-containing protein [Thermoleophilaceae bacterium]|nr:FHA domain-containing protein [Thermoleophilaceae bacterium]